MANLKQELASVEERVAYQAQERARDIQVDLKPDLYFCVSVSVSEGLRRIPHFSFRQQTMATEQSAGVYINGAQ